MFKTVLLEKWPVTKLEYHDAYKCVFLSIVATSFDGKQDKTRRIYIVNLNNEKFYQIEITKFCLEFLPCADDNTVVFKVNGTTCFKNFEEATKTMSDQF